MAHCSTALDMCFIAVYLTAVLITAVKLTEEYLTVFPLNTPKQTVINLTVSNVKLDFKFLAVNGQINQSTSDP